MGLTHTQGIVKKERNVNAVRLWSCLNKWCEITEHSEYETKQSMICIFLVLSKIYIFIILLASKQRWGKTYQSCVHHLPTAASGTLSFPIFVGHHVLYVKLVAWHTMSLPLKRALFVVHGPVSWRLWWSDLRQKTSEKTIKKETTTTHPPTHPHTHTAVPVSQMSKVTW